MLDLLTADYTFVNERLARHYGIPNVYGSHSGASRVTDEARKGLLGKGSILTVTSYAEPHVAGAARQMDSRNLLARRRRRRRRTCRRCEDSDEQRSAHDDARADGGSTAANPVAPAATADGPARLCAGELRRASARGGRGTHGAPIDASGELADGTRWTAGGASAGAAQPTGAVRRDDDREAADLRAGPGARLLTTCRRAGDRPGRGTSDYRFSSLVLGIVKSVPFQMRMKAD